MTPFAPYAPALLSTYAAMSVLAFTLYGRDKAAARRGRWRVSEATLHVVALLGGWPGALLAQGVFRHKTRKRPFRIVFWCTVALNCAALLGILLTRPPA